MEIPLTLLKNGETGVITSADCGIKGKIRRRHRMRKSSKHIHTSELCIRRLNDLGLTPGTEVTVIKSAPFNGPLEICVRGSRLAIGRGIASRILVDAKK
jgi:Fe2+ transport system protein FeoA